MLKRLYESACLAVTTRSAARAAETPQPPPSTVTRRHRLGRTPIRPAQPFGFQDFLRETDIQFLDHMRRGASINLADLASDPQPNTLQVWLQSQSCRAETLPRLLGGNEQLSDPVTWARQGLQEGQVLSHIFSRLRLCFYHTAESNLERRIACRSAAMTKPHCDAGLLQADVHCGTRDCTVQRRHSDAAE